MMYIFYSRPLKLSLEPSFILLNDSHMEIIPHIDQMAFVL